MKPTLLALRPRLFTATLLLVSARSTCLGQLPVSSLSKAALVHSIGRVGLIASHVSLALLKTKDISTLTVTGIMVMSLMAIGITTIKLVHDCLAIKPGATTKRLSESRVRALRAAAITGFVLCVFELSKMALFPNIGTWVSHSSTILFIMLLVPVIGRLVFKREERLRLEMSSTEERYRLLFEKSLTGA